MSLPPDAVPPKPAFTPPAGSAVVSEVTLAVSTGAVSTGLVSVETELSGGAEVVAVAPFAGVVESVVWADADNPPLSMNAMTTTSEAPMRAGTLVARFMTDTDVFMFFCVAEIII